MFATKYFSLCEQVDLRLAETVFAQNQIAVKCLRFPVQSAITIVSQKFDLAPLAEDCYRGFWDGPLKAKHRRPD